MIPVSILLDGGAIWRSAKFLRVAAAVQGVIIYRALTPRQPSRLPPG